MAAPTLSVAIPTSSYSFSSSPVDHFSLNFFPYKPNHIKAPSKLKAVFNYSHSCYYSFSWSSTHCASTAFDGVDLDQEEEEEEEYGEEEEPLDDASESAPEAEEENNAPRFANGGRLYVGNLPFSMTSSQLAEVFSEAGRVVSAEVVYDRVTDRSRGFAFVTMGSVEEAKEANRLFDGVQIGGRTAKVNSPEVPRGGERELTSPKIRSSYQGFVDSPYKLYAGNLSWNLTSQTLREAFAQQPGFLSAKVVYDRDSGRSRGYGFITFSSPEQVDAALTAMNGLELEGRPLRLNLAEQRTPLSPPPSENIEVFSSATA